MIKKILIIMILFVFISGCTKIEQPKLNIEDTNQAITEFTTPEFKVINLEATNNTIRFEFEVSTDLSILNKVRVAVKKSDKNSYKFNNEIELVEGLNLVEITDLDEYKYIVQVLYLDPKTGLESFLYESTISVISTDYEDFDNPEELVYISLNQEKIIHEAYFEYYKAHAEIIAEMKNVIVNKGTNDTFKLNGRYIVSPDSIKLDANYLAFIKYLIVKKIEIEPFLENIAVEVGKIFYYTEIKNDKEGLLYEFTVPGLVDYFEDQMTWEERNTFRTLNSKVLFENFPQLETPLIEMKPYYPAGGLIELNSDNEYEYESKLVSSYLSYYGEDVYAPMSGTVTSKTDYSIVIDNPEFGRITISNLKDITVGKNEEIEANELIGKVGYNTQADIDSTPLLTIYFTKGRYTMNYDFYRDHGKKYDLELSKVRVKDGTASITSNLYSEINYSTMATLYKDGILVENRYIGDGSNLNEFHNIAAGSSYKLVFGYINNYEFDDDVILLEEVEFRG